MLIIKTQQQLYYTYTEPYMEGAPHSYAALGQQATRSSLSRRGLNSDTEEQYTQQGQQWAGAAPIIS